MSVCVRACLYVRVQGSVCLGKRSGEVLSLGGGAQGARGPGSVPGQSPAEPDPFWGLAGRGAWRRGGRTEGRPGSPRRAAAPAPRCRPRWRSPLLFLSDEELRGTAEPAHPAHPVGLGSAAGERGPHRCSAGRRRLCRERARLPLSCPGRSPRGAHHERRRSGLLGMASQVPPGEKVEALCK